jgi:ABC-2 type transport system permease protein
MSAKRNHAGGNGKALVVLAFEFRKMAANKAFILTTLLAPVLLAAIIAVPAILTAKSMDRSKANLKIGVYVADGDAKERAERFLDPVFSGRGWTPTLIDGEAECKAKVLDGSLDGYLTLPADFPYGESTAGLGWYTKSSTDIGAASAVGKAVSDVLVSARMEKAGVDEKAIRALTAPVDVPSFRLSAKEGNSGKKTDENDFLGTLFIGMAFALIIYMTVLLYGQQIGRSVVADKSTKIVDVLLSSVRTEELLFGKIAGIGLAGIVQYAVWILWGVIATGVAGALNPATSAGVGADKLLLLGAFFIGGYLLYSSLYAACGSASEDDQHMAQLAMPLIVILMIPIFILQGVIQQPDSPLSVALSYIPFTSPTIMPVRALAGNVAGWEIALSLAILALTVFAMIKVAAKIFRIGIRMSGKNFSLKDIARWIAA